MAFLPPAPVFLRPHLYHSSSFTAAPPASPLNSAATTTTTTARLMPRPPPVPPKRKNQNHDQNPPPSTLPNTAADSSAFPTTPLTSTARLHGTSSPYLLSHASDPVQWHTWGEAAFAAAASRNVPILLSSGFLTCHWCSQMHVHFCDPAVARILNSSFVCVLLDREERPDVDDVYQAFVSAVSPDGRSGWPLTVFLTPHLRPFVGVTYLTRDRLASAASSIADRWQIPATRQTIVADAQRVIDALADMYRAKLTAPDRPPTAGKSGQGGEALRAAYDAASTSFDGESGGFGAPPKFPRPSLFEFLAGTSLTYGGQGVGGEARDMLDFTLLKMSQGGIFDQVGGRGFFRYSLDSAWATPRFEKLLSDQAQLAMSYLFAWLVGGKGRGRGVFRDVVCSTLDYCLEDMMLDGGIFASATDSDSVSAFDLAGDGARSEGAFYLWSDWELKLVLGEAAGNIFSMRYGIQPEGNLGPSVQGENFAGMNIPRVTQSIADIARVTGRGESLVLRILDESNKKLAMVREDRPKPRVDELVIVAWNSMLISALARAGRALNQPKYLDAAFRAMDHILDRMVSRVDDDLDAIFLYRTYRAGHGPGKVEAFATDYCAAIQACIDCYEAATLERAPRYLSSAVRLQNALDSSFLTEEGAYATAAEGDEAILLRQVEDYDGAEPSPSSLGALNGVRLASITGEERYWKRALGIAAAFAPVLARSPLAMPMLLVAVQAFVTTGKRKVVVIGSDEEAAVLLDDFWSRGLPRSVVLLRLPLDGPSSVLASSLSSERRGVRPIDRKATGYVCTGESCHGPTTDAGEFSRQLDYLVAVSIQV